MVTTQTASSGPLRSAAGTPASPARTPLRPAGPGGQGIGGLRRGGGEFGQGAAQGDGADDGDHAQGGHRGPPAEGVAQRGTERHPGHQGQRVAHEHQRGGPAGLTGRRQPGRDRSQHRPEHAVGQRAQHAGAQHDGVVRRHRHHELRQRQQPHAHHHDRAPGAVFQGRGQRDGGQPGDGRVRRDQQAHRPWPDVQPGRQLGQQPDRQRLRRHVDERSAGQRGQPEPGPARAGGRHGPDACFGHASELILVRRFN